MTTLGKTLASLVILLRYGLIAVLTGIVLAEFKDAKKRVKKGWV